MKRKVVMKNADEYDALTKARKWYNWKRGELKRIKNAFNRRERRQAREEINERL